ncbi:MAG: Glyoxalase/bleomycin resistance protein/dioxygenase [Bryobacterales bacterium]|jgi:PhnB protein|nr:Glyoxalase/bleomycin resistance protein/dioxygenase [Bryobacterales bacterium]
MATQVRPIPEGYHTATPYLICDGAAQAIDFYKQAFGAVEIMRMPMPNGKLGHAEIKIGDSHIMLADENPEQGARSPKSYGGSPISVLLYVEKVDAVVAQAVSAGGKMTRPLKDEFYGDRTATVVDPFGHTWYIHTHIKDVSPEEMKKAMQSAGQ